MAMSGLCCSGDVVRIIVTDHQDRRSVEDILCTDESCREIFGGAGSDSNVQATRQR